jgi:hypothetical protein
MQLVERVQRALEVAEKLWVRLIGRLRHRSQQARQIARAVRRRMLRAQVVQKVALEICHSHADRANTAGTAAAQWQMALSDAGPAA